MLANILLLRSWSTCWSPSFYFGLLSEGVCWLILGGSIELGVGQLLDANFILYMLAPCILFLVGQGLLLATLEWKFERGVGEHSRAKVQKDKKGVDQHSSAKIMEYMLVPFILFWFVW